MNIDERLDAIRKSLELAALNRQTNEEQMTKRDNSLSENFDRIRQNLDEAAKVLNDQIERPETR